MNLEQLRFSFTGRAFGYALMLASAVWFAPAARAEDEKEPTAAQTEFFEKKIRPVLVEKCYSCHSHDSKKVKGGYYIDSRDAARKGGKSGDAAIVPGKPDKSPLLAMIARKDADSAMPPKEKDALTPEQVKDFEAWIKDGAPDPRKEAPKGGADKKSADAGGHSGPDASTHWAFVKSIDPPAPTVKETDRVHNPIDAFVLATLESKNMKPAPLADKRTLIRRAYFDLIGLPPTPEQIATFEADASTDAFAKIVDELLASPRYGERWGRYWLDVARYADTKGYSFESERRFPYSYTYRDYVIRAFNEDLPYDQFLIQQIAADKLDLGADKRPLAAMGFLTVGRRFLENQSDIIDDRIDVVTRGMMGLTVQCARCHDHKYDPIPTQDYYSLYGVFSSSIEPASLPSIGQPEATAASLAFQKELQAREAAVESLLAEKSDAALKELRSPTGIADYLMAGQFTGTPNEGSYVAGLNLKPKVVQRWVAFLSGSKSGHSPQFSVWQAYAAIAPSEFAAKSGAVTEALFAAIDPAKPIHPVVVEAFRGKPPTSMREVAERYGVLLAAHSQEAPFTEPDKESLRMVLYGRLSPLYAVGPDRTRFLSRDVQSSVNALKQKVESLKANDPGAPPLAMVMNDSPTPGDVNVFKRGNPGMPGEKAPRRFLKCLSGPERKPFTDGSGRLELARAIASKDNPLTARVMVNRVWLNHFGAGLVRTPSDFGVRCEPPAHPELLDWLATRFMEGGWSIKKLHRTIMLSSTWQQASDGADVSYATADPENTLLWRQGRRRMDFEAMRDTFLTVAGQLDDTLGGKPVDIIDAANSRRTVYGFIDRQNLPGEFRTFDFASPDTHSPARFFTTAPQQALFMLNSPFVERVTRRLAARKEVEVAASTGDKIDRLYHTLYGRAPSAEERSDGEAFITSEQMQVVSGANSWRYGFGRYDASSDRVVTFTALNSFETDSWHMPKPAIDANPKLRWVILSAAGGHPGADAATSAIRRWIAPADGTIDIGGIVSHKQDKGDGILARVVSSRSGQLSSWTLDQVEAATQLTGVRVQRGDTLDFIVECRTENSFDAFTWAPTIRLARTNMSVAGGVGVTESDAQREFAGPSATAMTPWEKYTQVLLLSNEFAFVD